MKTRKFNLMKFLNGCNGLKSFVFIALVFVLLYPFAVFASMEPSTEQETQEMPIGTGTIQGTGTYFTITESDYLPIILHSSETINVYIQSIPKTIFIRIESSSSAASTEITLEGFPPFTTYCKYEDNYHNLSIFTTDGSGRYVYTQDISEPHLVFIQTKGSTIFISNTGWSDPSVGTWDLSSRTATLTRDLSETIQIDDGDITLDGNGHTLTGSETGSGILINGRAQRVSVKNLSVNGFSAGISFITVYGSSYHTVTFNRFYNNYIGIRPFDSDNNIFSNNIVYENRVGAALAMSSAHNIFSNNIVYKNISGIECDWNSSFNTIMDNVFYGNKGTGISLYDCAVETFTGNFVYNNYKGIVLREWSNNHIIKNNTFINNEIGIELGWAPDDFIYNNNFINNSTQVKDNKYVYWYGTPSVFNLSPPEGGNYWNNWTSPDVNCNGFVDSPYILFISSENVTVKDDYPWTIPSGWLSPVEHITKIINFFDKYVDADLIIGYGTGKAAKGRLIILRNMLLATKELIDHGRVIAARGMLKVVYVKTDGAPNPPDVVQGEAVSQLATMIEILRMSLECR